MNFPNSSSARPQPGRRKSRVQGVGQQVCRLGLPLFFAGALAGLYWQAYEVAVGNFTGAVGCYLSLKGHLLQKSRSADFLWWPAYLGFFLSSIPAIYFTGGVQGPLCLVYVTLLFLTGVALQAQFSTIAVFGVHFGYFLVWGALSFFSEPPPSILPPNLVIVIQGLFLIGALIPVTALLQIEEKQDLETASKQRQLEEAQGKLTHTSKMAEVGDLLATTAHELAQPVQVISISQALLESLLIESGNTNETHLRLLARIKEAAARLTRLLNQLRTFSRRDPFHSETFDLRETIHSVQLLTEHDLRTRNIEFSLKIPSDPIWVSGDHSRIQQVLLNLINNARDASASSTSPWVQVVLEKCNSFARIYVKNNGQGIPLDVQGKLFQPYFTTKMRGKGTGLGLTISSELVEQHRGRLLFSSEQDQTVFVVDIPMNMGFNSRIEEKNSA